MTDATSDDPFLVTRRDGVLTITLNRPDQGNAMPPHAVPPLAALFRDAQGDSGVRTILIAGRGKNFCSGGNVAGFAEDIARGTDALIASFRMRMANLAELVQAVVAFDRPIIAAVRGAAAGAGIFYALAADMVVADQTAAFLFAHQRMGLSPDAAVSWLLPRAVGVRHARLLLFRTARVLAQEGLSLGLISELVDAGELDATADQRAAELARAPQRAIRNAKRLIGQALSTSLADHLRDEGESIVACVADPDFAEGVHAFIEKRPVRFPSTRG